MKDTPLNRFVEKVMGLGSGFVGMGNASAGIVGAVTVNDQVLQNLRCSVLNFAAEYSRSQRDHDKIAKLAQSVEGALETARVFSSLSDKMFEELVQELDSLVAAIPAK